MIRFAAAALVGCLAFGGAAEAHSYKQKRIEIVHPWSRPAAKGETVVVSMLLRNRAKGADRLVGVRSAFGGSATLAGAPHGALAVPAKGEVALKRDGPHIEIATISKALDPYDGFALTLVFEKAGAIEVEVVVEDAAGH